ncbi:Histidine kinase-like ATPase domain-containing protein [Oceanospirillum multiglobuliferum]|uniref:Response regulatory domain-containing protein n=1 Tax=Oceanospirillum multiglobuliferum TaxID=64969 RepID=A0A1T4RX99_9GAMM|nr:SpoIIE family protein phosphatase [Oceanospirillum multiglobuliferum]OPX54592.1 hypothetical protein BTE48_13510 [Oceanospirillum multiglobuliferum]SKA20639.1 Histidine kinase-like ATPase domain-containing protein [Oceanospirillum multiglobuliferum]
MERQYQLHFEYSPQLPRKARHALAAVLLHSSLQLEQRNTILLAVTELTANLLRHSTVKPTQINLECRWSHQHYSLTLADNGSAFTPQHCTALDQLLEEEPNCSGYGLALLQEQFDQVDYIPATHAQSFNRWCLQLKLEQQFDAKLILLVDDDLIQLNMIAMYLEPHQVQSFTSAREAEIWLKTHQPDLIISDIRMPEIDGLSFRHQISHYSHLQMTPFIFLTGDDDAGLAESVVHKDIDDFLLKPVQREQINQVITRVIQRSQRLLQHTFALIDRDLKQHLRPSLPAQVSRYQVASLSYSAQIGGGDYWLCPPSDQLQLYLGDVMGHDIAACFMAGRQQGFLQGLQHQACNLPPTEQLTQLSQWLDQSQPELLTTLQILIAQDDQLVLFNAGALPPWHISQNQIASLPCTGALLGLNTEPEYQGFTFHLKKGERLMLFSDGLLEISNQTEQQVLHLQQLQQLICEQQDQPLTQLQHALDQWISQHQINDDISVILLEKIA